MESHHSNNEGRDVPRFSEDIRRPEVFEVLEVEEQGAVTTPQAANRQPKVHIQFGRAANRIFAVHDRMNQVLIEHLDSAAWRANHPPGFTL
jgi:hypothetical protein